MSNEVAVIGMDCRLPGAENVSQFWQNLRESKETISRFEIEELRGYGITGAVLSNPRYVPAKGYIADAECFDAEFFGMTPKEAESTDPQHRILLECAWNTLESAAYDPNVFKGRIGIYAGCGTPGYVLTNVLPQLESDGRPLSGLPMLIASDKDHLTSRIAYKLNLRGPAVTVQTACSTSLVAVHMACQALIAGDCEMALAGGVNVTSPLKNGYLYEPGNIVSPDGHCRAFDAAAQGTVFGDGAGLVLLKKLSDAIVNRDFIHAIILGSAINNDGHRKIGYSAPSVQGERDAIIEALKRANKLEGVYDVDYIEAHGTGTPLGDPIEVAALREVAERFAPKNKQIALGSVKSNVGHLDAAAGITGMIKAILAVEHGEIPATLHYETENPDINFGSSGLYVNNALRPWPELGRPRRAAVSSFGVGGTNAHLILEEAPQTKDAELIIGGPLLLVLSAKSSHALEQRRRMLARYLEEHPELSLQDVAFTLQTGRHSFVHREYLVVQTLAEAAVQLNPTGPSRRSLAFDTTPSSVAFILSGHGGRLIDAGRALYEHEEVFRDWIDRCSQLLMTENGWSLRALLFPKQEDKREVEKHFARTEFSLPALFSVEYALTKLWMHRGVSPIQMLGHGLGEWVAAAISGVFAFEDAIRFVTMFGRLVDRVSEGAMLAAHMDEAAARWFLEPNIFLASIDAADRCVFSGTKEALELLQSRLSEDGIRSRRLPVACALQVPLNDADAAPLRAQLEAIPLGSPRLPFISGLSGTEVTIKQATSPHYWMDQLQCPLRFHDGWQHVMRSNPICLEVGPSRIGADLSWNKNRPQVHPISAGLCENNGDELAQLATTTGELWLHGVPLNWNAMYGGSTRRVPLPTYAFERRRHWIDVKTCEVSTSTPELSNEICPPLLASKGPRLGSGQQTEKDIQTRLNEIAKDLTGLEIAPLTEEANLAELGMDSLLTISLMQSIRDQFGVEIPAGILLDGNTTLRTLTSYLHDRTLQLSYRGEHR